MPRTRITFRSNMDLFLLICRQGAGATVRSAVMLLIAGLLAASPLPVSGATPDPVLEWIGVMNSPYGRYRPECDQPHSRISVGVGIRRR